MGIAIRKLLCEKCSLASSICGFFILGATCEKAKELSSTKKIMLIEENFIIGVHYNNESEQKLYINRFK